MTSKLGRTFGLDLLRALAVLFVVYGHGYSLVENIVPKNIYNLWMFDGVTMFFVLSGFLIGRILLPSLIMEKGFRFEILVSFWLRRWFRTLPNYLLVLSLIILAYDLQLKPLPINLHLYYLFSQNIASPHPAFFPEAWSLAIEEWFYLATPALLSLGIVLFNKVQHQKIALYWIIAIIVTVTTFRVHRVWVMEEHLSAVDWDLYVRKQVLTRMDSLMYGVLGAYCSLFWGAFWNTHAKLCVKLGLGLLLVDKTMVTLSEGEGIYVFYMKYCVFTVNSVAVLLLLPWLASWKRAPSRCVSVITCISLISYSIYLIHFTPVQAIILPLLMPVFSKLCTSYGQEVLLSYGFYWLITFNCAYLLYHYFEKPVMGLREKWHFKRQPVISVLEVSKV